ncbi:RagB/SusD family nutrient uptake outer membrane protein [Winogradskyella sp. F6397]|uniref:RagB/SusD family nutrient uptake outer membrane protein n=1 Tax=Winogradskyella marina TaxID=2785530 RepID=A0ABS0EIZ3_9FLAO|nr:RagB/SusD family nutrient uptake outer membrane protein [Winogradskyella marina]MBF8150106.1 RagB/SusD family nutrient uptake outer membrane protein [Winogradskyella marina]
MKKFNKLLIVGVILTLMGCNDAIDIRQVGRLDAANAFKSVDDLQNGLLAVYDEVDLTPEIALSANFTDEIAIGFDSGGQGFALYDFVMNAASAAPFDFWTRNFRVNNRATILIEAAQNITPSDAAEQAMYDDILAQAHFIRAYANFEMLVYFSPDARDDSTLAVPVIDFIPGLDIQPRRNTTGEVWDYINSDIDIATSRIETQSDPLFVSLDAINALKARMAMTRGDYPLAETLSSQLLNSYGLANRTQYANMFLDNDNTEVIFKLERTVNDSYDGQTNSGSVNTGGGWAGSVFAFVNATLAGSPYFEMDRSVFDALDPNDIRYDVMVAPSSIISPDYPNDPSPITNDVLVIQKYQGSEGKPLMNDLKVFRSSEMLLILAEAKAAQNDLDGAEQLIKQLRDARFGTAQALPSYGTQQEAFGAILDERKIELAFEGHRFKDLKRLGVAGNRGVDRDPIACGIQSGACTLPASDFRFTLPIPIVEINANPGIAAQQNPGYTN